MTRLRVEDVAPIEARLEAYDAHLRRITGASLREIAGRASGVSDAHLRRLLDLVSFAAVPITSGLGVIGGFSEAVAAIISHLGFSSMVTESCDSVGMEEGMEKGADVLMVADDERYLAMVSGGRQAVDNSAATGQGFVAALQLMRGSLAGEPVLVLGCGPVGLAAAKALIGEGALVALCDTDGKRARMAAETLSEIASGQMRVEDDPVDALARHTSILDATDSGGFIESGHLAPGTLVAAPGMPCALTPEAMAEHRDRVIHDALEIGTATMAVQAAMVATRLEDPGRGGRG